MSDDDRWSMLTGGYRTRYDPRPALKLVEQGQTEAGWNELWDRLQHQGNVGTASYAAVPEIVKLIRSAPSADCDAYALLATIEEYRLAGGNPALPSWLEDDYRKAWTAVLEPALRHFAVADHDPVVRSILAVLAHAKGQTSIGAIALCTEDERQEMLHGEM